MSLAAVGLPALVAATAIAAPQQPQPTLQQLADQVLHNLAASPLGKALPHLSWDLRLTNLDGVDASSDGRGKIFVNAGMTFFLGRARGVWAAVLAHEIGHALILHPDSWPAFEAELRGECEQAHADCAGDWGRQPLFGYSSGTARFDVSHPKTREYAADFIATVLMAAAGYDPQFALTLDRWMIGSIADPPRLTEFLDSHPRWAEREARTRQEIAPASAIFRRRWPDAAKSPGGIAAGGGQLGRVEVALNADGSVLTIRAPVTVLHAAGAEVRVTCVFLGRKAMVESSAPEFRAPNGELELNRSFPGSDSDSRVVTFRLPLSAISNPQPRLHMLVFLLAGDMVLDRAYLPMHLDLRRQTGAQ